MEHSYEGLLVVVVALVMFAVVLTAVWMTPLQVSEG